MFQPGDIVSSEVVQFLSEGGRLFYLIIGPRTSTEWGGRYLSLFLGLQPQHLQDHDHLVFDPSTEKEMEHFDDSAHVFRHLTDAEMVLLHLQSWDTLLSVIIPTLQGPYGKET